MSSDVFAIYQIDNSEKNREYRCRSYEYQIQHHPLKIRAFKIRKS